MTPDRPDSAAVVVADDALHRPVPGAAAGSRRSPPPARRLRLPLATVEDCRRELARVYREVKSGAIPSDEGTRRAYILVSLSKMIEAGELERRIEAMEALQRAHMTGGITR